MNELTKFIKTPKGRLLSIVFILLILMLSSAIVISSRRDFVGDQVEENFIAKVDQEGNNLTVNADGSVTLKTQGGRTYFDVWSQEKIDEFLQYLSQRNNELNGNTRITLANGTVITINDDELISVIVDETINGTGNSGTDNQNDDEDDLTDIFDNPTATATPTGQPSNPLAPPPGCRLWRLSYCADRLFQTPSPTQGPTQFIFEEANCEAWNESNDSPTIISNTVCLD